MHDDEALVEGGLQHTSGLRGVVENGSEEAAAEGSNQRKRNIHFLISFQI